MWSSELFEVMYNIRFANTIEFPSQRKKLFKSVHKQEIGLLWSKEAFEVKYNIGFGIPIEFQSQRKIIIQVGPLIRKLGNWIFVVQRVI